MPKVTVCIPTYNRAHLVRESIQSVLDQTFSDFELLISDNASTDDTAAVVASFNDPCIRYHRQPTNIGLAANHQSAVAMANTEFVAILSDDDLYKPDHLAVALAVLADYPNAAYYSCSLERFGDGASGIWTPAGITDTTMPLVYFSPKQAVDFLGIENPGFLNALVCRKDRLKSTLFWGKPGFIHADVLIMTQLMIQGGCVLANRPTVRYRYHEANVSRPIHDKFAAQRVRFMLQFAVRYLAQLLLDTATCAPPDIEAHGLAITPQQAALLILSLGSLNSSPALRALAKRIFEARHDVDHISLSCRLARCTGFAVIPLVEQISLLRCGWRP
jgi:glycosyltransferase involved in cell wall biosynthesis